MANTVDWEIIVVGCHLEVQESVLNGKIYVVEDESFMTESIGEFVSA